MTDPDTETDNNSFPVISFEGPDEVDQIVKMTLERVAIIERCTIQPLNCRMYFAYGPNISTTLMQQICPNSHLRGTASLVGYRWCLNSRGEANILQKKGSSVYGLVYAVSARDEMLLDEHENIPHKYRKYAREVLDDTGRRYKALVYMTSYLPGIVNDEPGVMSLDYLNFMKVAIKEALFAGLLQAYVEKVLKSAIRRSEWKIVDAGEKAKRIKEEEDDDDESKDQSDDGDDGEEAKAMNNEEDDEDQSEDQSEDVDNDPSGDYCDSE